MKPLLLLALGGGAVWLLVQQQQQRQVNRLYPQNQRGIGQFSTGFTPQMPAQVYASMITPPGASRSGGYVPAFGPYADLVDPSTLYFNQA